MCTSMFTQPADGSYITTPGNKTPRSGGVPVGRPAPIRPNPVDVPLGTGMLGGSKNAILTRAERLRIAEEGS